MELITVKKGADIKKGDIVRYSGSLRLVMESADSDGDIYVVDADNATIYVAERRVEKVYNADGTPYSKADTGNKYTIEFTEGELKVIVADMGMNSHNETVERLEQHGYGTEISEIAYDLYKGLQNILEEVAK